MYVIEYFEPNKIYIERYLIVIERIVKPFSALPILFAFRLGSVPPSD